MPAPVDHLFVYGTLRRGCDNPFARLLSEQGQFVCEARVPGRLHDFGAYPGAVPSDRPELWTRGEIHRLEGPQLLIALDNYEGPEFQRALVTARLNDGRTIDCWIYWYAGTATGSLIASGDWLTR